MAICNLFDSLNNPSGNFMMFSQYVEDITRNTAECEDNYKVVPSRFVALNIDYSNINKRLVSPEQNLDNINTAIPKYFQNCFENACAWGRNNFENIVSNELDYREWNSEISRNLFWNCMIDGEFIHIKDFSTNYKYIPEVVYWGDINMRSYNEHQGMGYEEIYCYIPSDGEKMNSQVIQNSIDNRVVITPDSKGYLEGYSDQPIEGYSQKYYFNRDFSMSFDTDEVVKLRNSADTLFNINTIVVLYDVLVKNGDSWEKRYSYIPMGMYIVGNFDSNDKLTNTINKYVTTSYGTGTSYGLRICTRFSVSPNGVIRTNHDLTVDDSKYENICQLMCAMNENLSLMLDMSRRLNDTTQIYKDTLATIKNNQTNVPYVKNVNGSDCWFVNGKFVGKIDAGVSGGCNEYSEETIRKRFNALQDNDPTNDTSYIEDSNGPDCLEIPMEELADILDVEI